MKRRRAVAASVLLTGITLVAISPIDAHRRPYRHSHAKRTAVIVVGQPRTLERAVVIDGRAHGVLDMNVEPKATEVWLDGKFRGTCDALDGHPDKLYVRPGEHVLKLVTPDGEVVKRDIVVRSGVEMEIGLDLR